MLHSRTPVLVIAGLALSSSTLQAQRTSRPSQILGAVLTSLEETVSGFPEGKVRNIDLGKATAILNTILEEPVGRSELRQAMPAGYRDMGSDSILVCPDEFRARCRIRDGGAMVSVDSIAASQDTIQVIVTWRVNRLDARRGTEMTQWEFELQRAGAAWKVVQKRRVRMS